MISGKWFWYYLSDNSDCLGGLLQGWVEFCFQGTILGPEPLDRGGWMGSACGKRQGACMHCLLEHWSGFPRMEV